MQLHDLSNFISNSEFNLSTYIALPYSTDAVFYKLMNPSKMFSFVYNIHFGQ